jgi:Halocarboxylic acid dehydrogenase DehI
MASIAAHAGGEILEGQAEGKIKSIYDNIKVTLRVPMVNLVFRSLAFSFPEYLEIAWQQLQPNVATSFFEARADDLRQTAVTAMASLETSPKLNGAADAERVLRIFHYVNPKLLLAVGALRAAINGQQPKLQELQRDEKRQIATGIPPNAGSVTMIDLGQADERIADIFADIQANQHLSLVSSDFRALACWPDYFESAWGALKLVGQRPEYRRALHDLRRRTEVAVCAFPFRIELNTHTLRNSGLSESDLDGVRAVLNQYFTLLPGLVVNLAFLMVGAVGPEEAIKSPFPAAPR